MLTPWWVPAARDEVEQYLAGRGARVLEWGAGQSTAWLAQRSTSVRSIEHDPVWCETVGALLRAHHLHADLLSRPLGPEYEAAAGAGPYDLVVIDGRRRVACGRVAVTVLKAGGLLLLDNSERPKYGELIELLGSWPVTHSHQGRWRTSIWRRP